MKATAIRRAVVWISSIIMASFSLTGMVSAQTITNTGPNSTNTIKDNTTNRCTYTNTNNVSPYNSNYQLGRSGNASSTGNTGGWGGWGALDPVTAQANGESYAAWNNDLTNWIGRHAGGSDWGGTGDNTSWSPSGSGWNSWDPMTWQANNQSFGNWYAGVESYLDNNSPTWLLGWPASATGSGGFGGGASTGNVTNANNSNFTININNKAQAVAGFNPCGQSYFTPPVGGLGGGCIASCNQSNEHAAAAVASAAPVGGVGAGPGAPGVAPAPGIGGIGAGPGVGPGVGAEVSAPGVPAPVSSLCSSCSSCASACSSSCVSACSSEGYGEGNNGVIANTGPNSYNTVTSNTTNTTTVTNTNNVTPTNINTQSATSGNATSSCNTFGGGASTGNVTNTNSTAMSVNIVN